MIVLSISSYGVYATNYSVGGETGWDLTSDMTTWSASTIFNPGDNLVFAYKPIHNVLEVDEDAFDTCNTTTPISINNGGQTVITLDTVGTRYFICGTPGHCGSGLKVQVDVLLPGNSSAGNDGRRRRPIAPPKRSPPPTPPTPTPPPPPPPPPTPSQELPPSPEIPSIDVPSTPGPNCHDEGSATKILYHHDLVITSLMSSLLIFTISLL
ncbi:Plastocyanin-like [Macleaya cordata]|uniref:Plastocyanin-like n=1 Tax=Macleaya cordata TaxID=56857 RepID=A0A200PVE4_MACCD|nr:Plastocyanin-like [Macleaya cordata]